jgi:hypothetical protein
MIMFQLVNDKPIDDVAQLNEFRFDGDYGHTTDVTSHLRTLTSVFTYGSVVLDFGIYLPDLSVIGLRVRGEA